MKRLTALPLPPYTYVPGQQPHPRSDAVGHSYGRAEPTVSSFDPASWQECEAYLFGFDLFNHAFYWESHEQWEAVWLAAGRTGVIADFLKGLIKLSAAGVKAKEAKHVGFERHRTRAVELFSTVRRDFDRLCGLELQPLIDAAGAEVTTDVIKRGMLDIHLLPERS